MRQITLIFVACMMLVAPLPAIAAGPYDIRLPASPEDFDPQALTVVGSIQHYRTKKGDDLLEIARHYGLGYSELGVLYRHWDPFILPAGTDITISTLWIVPNSRGHQIIVNTAEMRLYYYINNNTQVYTFPIGMGVLDFRTPQGKFRVVEKKVNPAWLHPQVLAGQIRHVGDALRWGKSYGGLQAHAILRRLRHPWHRHAPGVGRLVYPRCIRMYPEHIKQLFPMVPMGASVEYIYEPAKIGFRQRRIYLSVHEDVYFKIPSMMFHVLNLLEQRGLADKVNLRQVMQALEEKNGLAVDITRRGPEAMAWP